MILKAANDGCFDCSQMKRLQIQKPATYRFWQTNNHAEICFTPFFMWQKLDYIHNNPLRSGIVKKAENFTYSSASNYFYGRQTEAVMVERLATLFK